jgi:hypothetical protein
MLEIIISKSFDFLLNQFPLLLLLAVVAVITWLLSDFFQKCKKCRLINKKNSREISLIHSEHTKEEVSIRKNLGQMNEKLNTLIALLSEKEVIKNKELFTTNSPVNLSAGGKNFVEELGWKAVFESDDEKKKLFDALDKLDLKLKYDVEKYSVVLLHELNGKRESTPFDPVKKHLYEHSEIDESEAIFACALYLRDCYLKYRKDIID